MSAITLDGDLIHYEVLGHGRPVILLHGWIGSWRYWVPTLQKLQATYRVYALDLYGFGDSGRTPTKYTLDKQVAMLSDFMRELGLPKAAFVGHGLGALVAAEFARRYPDKTARLMLVSAPLFDPGGLDGRTTAKPVSTSDTSNALRSALLDAARTRLVPGAVAALASPIATATATQPMAINPLASILTSGEALLGKAFKRSEPEYARLEVDVAKADAQAVKQSAANFDAARLLDTLRQLSMPVALVHGADDPILPPPPETVWQYVSGEKDNLLVAPLPNVRHFPMLEYDLFARLLSDFLDAQDVTRLEIKERWRRRTR